MSAIFACVRNCLSHCHQQSIYSAPMADIESQTGQISFSVEPSNGTDTPNSTLHSYPHHCPWLAFPGQSHHASTNSIQTYTAVKCAFLAVASSAAVVGFHVTWRSLVPRADEQLHHRSASLTGSDSSSSVG
jgi:hypothetical protein